MDNFSEGPDIYLPGEEENINTEPEENAEVEFRKPLVRDHKHAALIAVLSVLIAALVAGAVFLAFKLFHKEEYSVTSDLFFSSDLLTEQGESYTVYGSADFTVRNFADELRTSTQEIESFDVKVTADGKDVTGKCSIKTDGERLTAGKPESIKVSVVPPADKFGVPLEITLTGEPATPTLKATFTVIPDGEYTLTDAPDSVCCKLTLFANADCTFEITWDTDKVTADGTDPYVKSSEERGKCSVSLQPGATAEMYFFKEDVTADYSAKDADKVIAVKLNGAEIAASETTAAEDGSKAADD